MRNGVPMVSSLNVAERFGKQHKNVLQALELLECSAKLGS
jgi:phage regulator Rha-like protein